MPRPKLERTFRDERVMSGWRLTRNAHAALAWMAKQKTIESADGDFRPYNLTAVIQECLLKEFKRMREEHGLGELTDDEVKKLSTQKRSDD